jgi:hypothetical protein
MLLNKAVDKCHVGDALGSIPPGLTLAPDGTRAGTPTAPGPANFMIQADGGGKTARQVYSMTIASPTMPPVPAPSIPQTSTLLPAGDLHQPYAASLTATGGSQPYAWALTQGQLPAGLAISGLGLLSGNASEPGKFSFAITVTDTTNHTATALFTLTIRTPLTIANPNDLVARVGTPLNLVLIAAGGAPPYLWSTTDPLPIGLTFNSSGVLSGKPTAPGTTTLLITVHDSSSSTLPATATTTLQIAVTTGLAITTTALPTAAHNLPYTAVLTAGGGATPYTWTLGDGQLPTGLSLSLSGNLSGTPTAIGTYRFAIAVADTTAQTATTSYALTVADPLSITTTGPIPASLASPNTLTLTALGGTQPYACSLASGNLPAGLALASNGTISGTPTSAATTTITVSVHDSAQSPATASTSLTITAAGKLTISTTTLPTGYLTSPYDVPVQVSRGTNPYTWSLASGYLRLPANFAYFTESLAIIMTTRQPTHAIQHPRLQVHSSSCRDASPTTPNVPATRNLTAPDHDDPQIPAVALQGSHSFVTLSPLRPSQEILPSHLAKIDGHRHVVTPSPSANCSCTRRADNCLALRPSSLCFPGSPLHLFSNRHTSAEKRCGLPPQSPRPPWERPAQLFGRQGQTPKETQNQRPLSHRPPTTPRLRPSFSAPPRSPTQSRSNYAHGNARPCTSSHRAW